MRGVLQAAAALLLVAASARSTLAVPRTFDLGDAFGDNFTGFVLYQNLAVAESPDDRHVYFASRSAIEIFRRDPASQKLALVAVVEDGDAGGPLEDAQDVVLSPDGAYLYVADDAEVAPRVSVFARDSLTGQLAFLEAETEGVGGVFGLASPTRLALSPDGAYLYVSSGGFAGSIAIFARDAGTGALAFVGAVLDAPGDPPLDHLAGIAVSPDGEHLYASASLPNAVSVFDRDPVTGALAFVETQVDGAGGVSGLTGPTAIRFSPDGLHAYVATTAGVVHFGRNPATGALAFEDMVTLFNGARSLAISGDGAWLYAISSSLVARYARDLATGALAFVDATTAPPRDEQDISPAFAGGRAIALAPDGLALHAATLDGRSIIGFARDPVSGALTYLQDKRAFDSRIGLTGASAVAVAPDGAHVYVTSDADDAVVVLARDVPTGILSHVVTYEDGIDGTAGLDGARGVLVSPDGAHVYVVSGGSGTLTAYARDAISGALTLVDQETDGVAGVDGLAGAADVAASPDGLHLYVAGAADDAVAAFARDPGTGALTFIEVERDGVAGVSGLVDARAVALAPDGAHVYVAAHGSGGVAIFARDGLSGALTFVGTADAGADTDGARDLAVSADGANVYVAAESAETLAVFARDSGSGALALVEVERNDVLALQHFRLSPRAVVVSGDGGSVLVANDNAFQFGDYDHVIVFARDGATGALDYLHTLVDPPFGLSSATYGAAALAESPDGSHYYLAASDSKMVTTLLPGFAGCDAAPSAGCRAAGVAGGAKLKLLDKPTGGSDLLVWKWRALGEPTAVEDFGNPYGIIPNTATRTNGTHYALCAYDEAGVPSLVFRALVPAGPERWRQIPASAGQISGFKMKDRPAVPEGLMSGVLRERTIGKAKIVMKAKGERVTLPALPLALPLRVQLQSSDGECWESVFSPGGVIRSDAARFIGKSD